MAAQSTADTSSNRQRLTPVDRSWLRMDETANRMIITGMMFFEAPIGLEEFGHLLEERLATIPLFRRCIVLDRRGSAHWQDDPAFNIGNHLQQLELETPADKATLEQAVGRLMSEPFDEAHPPWAFRLVPFKGGTVVLSRLHHSLGDGVALMLVLLSMTELEAPVAGQPAVENPLGSILCGNAEADPDGLEVAHRIVPEVMNLMSRRSDAGPGGSKLGLGLKVLSSLTSLTFRSADPQTRFKGPLTTDKRAAWSNSIDLAEVRAIKAHLGGTLNDLLLTAMTGALRRYLIAQGEPVEGLDFRATVPVSIRKLKDLKALGNRFGLIFLALPVGIADPAERLAELQRRTTALKGSVEAGVVYGFLHAMGRSPRWVHQLVLKIFGMKATAVVTNVPGPRQQLYLCGQPINDMLFWVPQAGRLGLGISIASYNGQVRLGVTTDASLVPEPIEIVNAFHDELEHLRGLAPVGR
nr:putative diacyglycerol O-acyltransferase Mb3154c [Nerophis lumbriciformis]